MDSNTFTVALNKVLESVIRNNKFHKEPIKMLVPMTAEKCTLE